MIATAARPSVLTPLTERQQTFTSFPKQYVTVKKLHGIEITFRAIQIEDEPLLIEFHKTLSDQSVHFRYFGAVTLRERTLHERLRRHCAIDQTREFALVADREDAGGKHHILGVARLFKEPMRDEAEFAILISDACQGKGVGTYLLKLLVRVGRESHLRRIVGHILADNLAMTHVCRKVGFSLHFNGSIGEWFAEILF
ncbi:MAG TPA: GNAT family N-acetyltransferase [Pyrinomonadaceae bacterium]|nr:GNAT family N-acetyltransferase [Pyrinomonadaceae bacterium]